MQLIVKTPAEGSAGFVPSSLGDVPVFTGRKDKNGELIFEGDYVQLNDPHSGKKLEGPIAFLEGSFMIDSEGDWEDFFEQCLSCWGDDVLEVVEPPEQVQEAA